MNTKTTKFLAVLAVLAVAFAVFAAIAPANVSDATNAVAGSPDYYSPGATEKDVYSVDGTVALEEMTKNKAYVATTPSTTFTSLTGAFAATIYVLPGADMTVTATTSVKSITFISATADSDKKLTAAGNSITVTAASAFKVAVASNGAITLSGTSATISAAEFATGATVNLSSGTYTLGPYQVADLTKIEGKVTIATVSNTSATITGYTGSKLTWGSKYMSSETATTSAVSYTSTFTNATNAVGYTNAVNIASGNVTLSGADIYAIQTFTVAAGATLTAAGTVDVAGTVNVAGKFVIGTGAAVQGNGKITGNGEIDLKGTLNVTDGAINPSHKVYCTVNLYGGSTWTGYADSSGTWIFNIGSTANDKVATFHQLTNGTEKTGAEFTVHKSMSLADNDYARNWLDGETVDTVIVEAAATLTLPNSGAMIIGAGDSVTLERGANTEAILSVPGTITNKGTISMADSTQVQKSGAAAINLVTNSGNGKIIINGEEYAKTATTDATNASDLSAAIAAAIGSEESIAVVLKGNVNDATGTVDLGSKDVSIVLTTGQTNLNLKISDTGSLKIETGDNKYDGTIKIGTQKPITLADVKGDFTITKGSIVISGDAVTAGTIVVPADETAIIDGLTLASSGNLTITLNDGSKVIFRNDVTIAANSVIIGIAAEASAKVVVEDGASITGNGDLVIGAAGDDVKTTIEGTIKMKAGETLTIYGTVNLSSEITGSVVNNGTINLYTGADISKATITGTGEMKDKTSETEMEDLIFTGESAQGDITYTANQNVIVNGTWTLVKGAFITIKGSLNVPDGCKLVIEPGATLTIDNKTAVANIDGTIVIEEADSGKDNAAVFTVTTGAVYISGTATVKGIMDVPGLAANQPASVIVLAGGALNLAKTGVLTVSDNGSITVLTASSFTVLGSLNATNIYNYGTVTINTSVPASGSSTIYMAANAAVVDIVKFTLDQNNRTLTISDYGLLYYTDKSGAAPVSYYVGKAGIATFKTYVNQVVIGGNITGVTSPDYYAIVTGIKVVEKVTSKDAEYKSTTHGYVAPIEKAYTNNMLVDGQINVSMSYVGTGTAESAAKATAKVTTNGLETIEIAADTTVYVGFGVTLENAVNATLKVSGTLDADDIISSVDDRTPVFDNKGTMTLAGKGIATRAAIAIGGTINGAHIEVGILPIHTYVTVDKVLEMAAADPTIDDIALLGKNTMSKSATLPEDVVMTLSGATLNIGSTAGADVTFTIAADATLKGNGRITVNGTMYAYDQTDVKGNEIISDVKKVETNAAGKIVKNGWALWTNIVTAINTAQAGDVITIAKTEEQGYVTITSSTEIKDGVTVIVPEDAAPIYLKNGVTLTVSGVLSTEQDIFAEAKFDKTARNVIGADGKASAIVVNGLLLLPDAAKFANTYGVKIAGEDVKLSDGAPISGAYFKTDDNNAIASITVATENVDLIIGKIVLNGTVSASAVTFTATDDCSVMEIGNNINATYPTEVSITTLTLDGTTFQNESEYHNGTFTGTIANENGSVNVAGMTDAFVIKDKDDKLILGGAITTSAAGASISIASGTVFTADDLVVDTYDVNNMKSLDVAAGAQLTVSGSSGVDYVKVSGTVVIANEKTLSVSGDLTISGTVTVSPATTTKGAGSMTVTENIYVGMKASDLTESSAQFPTAGTATLMGGFTCNGFVYIAAGSNVDEEAQKVLDGMSTYVVFMVEDKEWFTVYTNKAGNYSKITVSSAPTENAQLLGWYDGITRADSDAAKGSVQLDSFDEKTLKAKVNYDIYSVKIYTDAGVKSVAIDGIELKVSDNANWFETVTKLKAGTHKVSYTLMDGYTGTPALYTLNYTILKDLSFTVNSESGLAYEFQLSGTEKYVPEPVTPEEQSEWTITTILLVILVILIAVMAVIVALRLNRS